MVISSLSNTGKSPKICSFYQNLKNNEKFYNFEFRTEDGLHENTHIEIDNGPSFIIKGSVTKKSLSFACVDGQGLSDKTRGIIGQFMHTDAYVVKDTEEADEDGNALGQVTAG